MRDKHTTRNKGTMSQKTSRKTVSSFCRCVGEEGETLRKGGWGVADCLEKRTRRRLNVTALVAPRRRNNGDSWPWRRNVKEKRGRGRKPFHTVCHTSLSYQFVTPVCRTSWSHQFVSNSTVRTGEQIGTDFNWFRNE